MSADGVEALHAKVVFDLTGVFPSDLRIDAKSDEQLRKEHVALIHAFGDLQSRREQQDHARGVEGDIAALPEALRGIADAGLGHAQFLCHVNGADVTPFLLQHEHGFQIVFRRFMYRHIHHQIYSIIREVKKQEKQRVRKLGVDN